MGWEIAQLTIWAGGPEERVHLRKVGKVELLEMFGWARVRKTGYVMISSFIGVVDGISKDARCP